VYHADLYRLGNVRELDEIGLFSVAAEGLAIVEWPERFPNAIPADAVWIELKRVAPLRRVLSAGGEGERVERLVGAVRG
jgi:tRNA A37 threonylcarbamoyladenosine biosynthesis protein TsaE